MVTSLSERQRSQERSTECIFRPKSNTDEPYSRRNEGNLVYYKHKTIIKMNTRHDNTINFMYFMNNFRQGFIFDVWKDDSKLATHLNNKFSVFCYESESSASALIKLFHSLDRENQCKLLEWVNENYKSFSNLVL